MYLYYKDYRAIEDHYRRKHFLCPNRECRGENIAVFETANELKLHMVAKHLDSKKMTKADRRLEVDIQLPPIRRHHQHQHHHNQRSREEEEEETDTATPASSTPTVPVQLGDHSEFPCLGGRTSIPPRVPTPPPPAHPVSLRTPTTANTTRERETNPNVPLTSSWLSGSQPNKREFLNEIDFPSLPSRPVTTPTPAPPPPVEPEPLYPVTAPYNQRFGSRKGKRNKQVLLHFG
jgi:hypothetical protein